MWNSSSASEAPRPAPAAHLPLESIHAVMTSSSSTPLVSADTQRVLRQAARALGRHGLAHAYGHCSLRLDDKHFLVCAPRPVGLMRPDDEGTVVAIDSPELPPGVLGEVRIHREIYRARPDVGGITRTMPRHTMSLSVMRRTPRVVHGMSAYLSPGVALWDDPQLIRNDEQALALARLLGDRTALCMRGNGAVVAGPSLQDAVVLTWYLEDAARIEMECLAESAQVVELTLEEADRRKTREGRIFERMWDYLTTGDPE